MGTKVHCKSYLPAGYYSMRDLNEDSSSSSWPLGYEDKPITNGPYYNGFLPKSTINGYGNTAYDSDALKQKMLGHEAVFKNQVYELHRLYRVQRNIMKEVDQKENRASVGLSSSSHQGFPFLNPTNGGKSISGVEIVNSPMSCTQRYNNTLHGPTFKDSEVLDSRPLKMRKKLFDLQLPADEYIDDDDTEEGEKLKSTGLADLNEPFPIEETRGVNRLDKSNGGYLGINGDGFLINSSLETKVNEKGRFSNIYETGCSSKNNLSSLSRGLQQDKLPLPCHQGQGLLKPILLPSAMHQSVYNNSREDHWREGNHQGLQSSYKNQDHSNNGHLDPLWTSHFPPGSYQFPSPSCYGSSRTQPVSSWAKPTSSFTQKVTPFEASLNSAVPIDRNLMTSAHNGQEPFGGTWLGNASSRSNSGSGSLLTRMNGFYQGSASGSEKRQVRLPSSGFGNLQIGSSRPSSKPMIDINLNQVYPKSLPNEADIIIIDDDTKEEEHLSALPWLKREPARNKKEAVVDLNQPFIPEVTFPSIDSESVGKKESGEAQNVPKILGFPIFEMKNEPPSSLGSTEESVNVNMVRKKRLFIDINLECEPDEEHVAAAEEPSKGTSLMDRFDLNSCLSDCEDPSSLPSYESKTTATVKTTFEIDLEGPPPQFESEDENTPSKELQSPQPKHETTEDKTALRDAAEAIFAMSSPCPRPESLHWFVDAITSSCDSELGLIELGSSSRVEMDEFEAMTLQIPETKEEDYMPKNPFLFDVEKWEAENASSTRGRRGHYSRRGRPRKNFQRDVLPGLATLSRNEVNEDIQTFVGLMRATGHHNWTSGMARRNGMKGRRGRKRAVVETPVCDTKAVQKPNNNKSDGGLVEDRSLIGWGKTTRRPRRQRCPSGNLPAAVVIT